MRQLLRSRVPVAAPLPLIVAMLTPPSLVLRSNSLQESTTSHLSRLTIIHQVLCLLVAEAGIEWCFPELLDQLEDEFVGDEADEEGVSDRRLMRLMCKSVEELTGEVKPEQDSGSIAHVGKKRRAED